MTPRNARKQQPNNELLKRPETKNGRALKLCQAFALKADASCHSGTRILTLSQAVTGENAVYGRVLIIGSLLIVAACGPVARDAPPPVAELQSLGSATQGAAQFTRANRALEVGDLITAREAFAAAMRSSPDDPRPALGLAETYLALGDTATAARLYGVVARSTAPDLSARVSQGLGLLALRQGRVEEAADRLADAVDSDPSLWRAWIGLGRARAHQRDWVAARAAFVEAEGRAPVRATVSNDIGMSFLAEKLPAQAVPHLERALELDPRNATARANLRIARAMAGNYEMAVSGAAPEEMPDALNNAGYVAVLNGDLDVADELLRRAVEISPSYHSTATANLDLLSQVQTEASTRLARGSAAREPRLAAASEAGAVAVSVRDRKAMLAERKTTPKVQVADGQDGFKWEVRTAALTVERSERQNRLERASGGLVVAVDMQSVETAGLGFQGPLGGNLPMGK